MSAPARTSAAPVVAPGFGWSSLTRRSLSLFAGPFGMGWWIGLAISGSLALVFLVSIVWVLARGVGVWGIHNTTAWGFAITNFVWWIGIGHAGTLISAILLLLRQDWRNSINRFAEAMTLFAIAMAGLFPLLHLGRVSKFFYLLPYPNQLGMWPQWRSPLVWDVLAVLTYGIVSLLFWYLGLLPDLATTRDFARRKWVRWIAGMASLGWRGSARQWSRQRSVYFILAAFATPLVVSVHSIVGLDFAVTIVPGWHATIFPPYFVAGAIFSGMAMVLTITIPLRRALNLHDLITPKHLDAMAKVTLTSALIVAFGYTFEIFSEWYSGDPFELRRMWARLAGPDAPIFAAMVLCNVIAPQALWSRRVRTAPVALFGLSILFNIGMWLERYDIVVSSLSHSSHMNSMRMAFSGTVWDWAMLAGSIGTFAMLFLLFVRVLPIVPIHEMRELVPEPERPGTRKPPGVCTADASVLLLRFARSEDLLAAARSAREHGVPVIEAYSPAPVHGLREALGRRRTRMPWAMGLGAIGGAGGMFALQAYSAVLDYPWNVGGRPLFSWPSFLPLTFEIGVLGGSLAGVAAFAIACGFPRPYEPLASAVASFARASADRFFLAVEAGETDRARRARVSWAEGSGAERVRGVR